jgi:hypothetical protein
MCPLLLPDVPITQAAMSCPLLQYLTFFSKMLSFKIAIYAPRALQR